MVGKCGGCLLKLGQEVSTKSHSGGEAGRGCEEAAAVEQGISWQAENRTGHLTIEGGMRQG